MRITATGDDDSGDGVRVDGGVCSEEARYGRAIHFGAANSGPMRGDGEAAMGMGS